MKLTKSRAKRIAVYKYLYYYSRLGIDVYRVRIERETPHFYFIGNNVKISKKTMRTGSEWHCRYYQYETPELLEAYK